MISPLLKIPWLRLKYRFLPNSAQQFWAQELLNSQGLTAKIGQVLAQGKTSALPKSTLKPKEAQILFEKQFNVKIKIQDEVLAASMGQVFFIEVDGQSFALKILHPGIKEKLHGEIENILVLGGYFAKKKGFSFDKESFNRFLTEVFEEETNLIREAHYQELLRKKFSHDSRFKIPRVQAQYSNDHFLCQELTPSHLAKDLTTFSSTHIFHFFFESLLVHGLLPGDLNDRNWGLQGEQTVIYDFGCTQLISERRMNGLKKLLMNQDVASGFRELGVRLESTWFRGREQELRDTLFGPLFNAPITKDLSYSQLLNEKFGEKIKRLRETTDPWVLLMMRSLFSLIRVYQDRGQEIYLGDFVKPYLTLKELPKEAEYLRIEVMEGKLEVVSLRFPVTAIENLESLMPENVLTKITAAQIHIPEIIQKVTSSGFAPQELFQLKDEVRSYRVWID